MNWNYFGRKMESQTISCEFPLIKQKKGNELVAGFLWQFVSQATLICLFFTQNYSVVIFS